MQSLSELLRSQAHGLASLRLCLAGGTVLVHDKAQFQAQLFIARDGCTALVASRHFLLSAFK
jgi:hypothetical protein